MQGCKSLFVQNFGYLDCRSFGCKEECISCMCHLNSTNKRLVICQILAGFVQLLLGNYRVPATLKAVKGREISCVHSGLGYWLHM